LSGGRSASAADRGPIIIVACLFSRWEIIAAADSLCVRADLSANRIEINGFDEDLNKFSLWFLNNV